MRNTLDTDERIKAVIREAREIVARYGKATDRVYVFCDDLAAALDAIKDIPCE